MMKAFSALFNKCEDHKWYWFLFYLLGFTSQLHAGGIEEPNSQSLEGYSMEVTAETTLLGPATETFFDKVDVRLQQQPVGEPMGEAITAPCDFDGDGDCDDADRSLFRSKIGICRGQDNYDPLADSDADGCITPDDEFSLFITDTDGESSPADHEVRPKLNSNNITQ